MAVSKFPRSMQTIDDILLEILTEEKPMALDLNRLDASLFAIQKYLYSVTNKSGRYLDHAEFFLDMVQHLRDTIGTELNDLTPETLEPIFESNEEMEERLRRVPRQIWSGKKVRKTDQGKMSSKQRQAIGLKMKAYWKKRRRDEKRAGR